MSTRDEPWPAGTPSWADLVVPDRVAATEFYGGLFGWEFTEGTPEQHFYVQAHFAGRPVAGIGEAPSDQEAPPAAWTTYLAVDDIDDAVKRVTTAGGTLMTGPADLATFGRMAIAADPGGAVFGLWEGREHLGARVVNEPGTMCWNEAFTRDFEASTAFYRDVFGYELLDLSGPDFQYVVLQLDGRPVGGVGAIGAEMQTVEPHWLTYFAVEDTDAAAARVADLGGTVRGAPRDSTYGRMALLAGPAGEQFSIIVPANADTGEAPIGTAPGA